MCNRNVHLDIYERVFEGFVFDLVAADVNKDSLYLFVHPFEMIDSLGMEVIVGHYL